MFLKKHINFGLFFIENINFIESRVFIGALILNFIFFLNKIIIKFYYCFLISYIFNKQKKSCYSPIQIFKNF